MKIVIDEAVCLKHKMSVEEFLLALTIRQIKDLSQVMQSLKKKEIAVCKEGNNDCYITQHWSEVMDEILTDSIGNERTDDNLIALAQKMKECFPQGKMPGTPYYYRCNNAEIVKKMKKFFIQHGDYPDEEIVDACKRFVASFNGDYKYLPLIKYFIFKFKNEVDDNGEVHKVEFSPLADYLENKEDSSYNIPSGEWSSKMI